MKSAFLDKLIDRLDKIDPKSLQTHFLRLTKERGLMEAVFNALHDGIIVLDDSSNITYANMAAAGLLGFSVESAMRQPIARFLKGIDWNLVLNLDAREWSKLISREIEITYPQHKYLNFYVMPILLKDGKEKAAVVIFRDVTHDREKEMAVLKSERMNAMTLLAAGVAHEIGNPLNSLHIHLQLMERELQAMDEAPRKNFEDLVQIAKTEVDRLNITIHQFLRAIRPTAPQRDMAALGEILRETLVFMKHEIASRDILVEINVDEHAPKISVDRNQIKQAFFNVIKNAVQAMTEGGMLTIRVYSNERQVGVSFKDTGAGIPPEELSQLFEPYRTTKTHGSGLGLIIVQRIVQDHGGEIEVHSQPGSGTTFTILLPVDDQRIRLLKAPAPKPKKSGGRRAAAAKKSTGADS